MEKALEKQLLRFGLVKEDEIGVPIERSGSYYLKYKKESDLTASDLDLLKEYLTRQTRKK